MSEVIHDRGPWLVNIWKSPDGSTRDRVVLQSDDFNHDAALEISGDFVDLQAKLEYARFIARQLNAQIPNDHLATVVVPRRPPMARLVSMATRYRHDFGLDKDPSSPLSAGLTDKERQVILEMMRQIYEEATGQGFYQPPQDKLNNS